VFVLLLRVILFTGGSHAVREDAAGNGAGDVERLLSSRLPPLR
jgi:hypothetical protein